MRERRIWTRKAVKTRVLRAKMEVFVKESMVAVLGRWVAAFWDMFELLFVLRL